MDANTKTQLMYDAHKKSLLIAYLLWFFLGSLGIHRFYVGKTTSAVLMLLLFALSTMLTIIGIGFIGLALLGLWWLIDALLIPSMVTQKNVELIRLMS